MVELLAIRLTPLIEFLIEKIHSLNVEVVRYRRIKFLLATHK